MEELKTNYVGLQPTSDDAVIQSLRDAGEHVVAEAIKGDRAMIAKMEQETLHVEESGGYVKIGRFVGSVTTHEGETGFAFTSRTNAGNGWTLTRDGYDTKKEAKTAGIEALSERLTSIHQHVLEGARKRLAELTKESV